MAQNDTVTFDKNHASFHLLAMSEVDWFLLCFKEVAPLH